MDAIIQNRKQRWQNFLFNEDAGHLFLIHYEPDDEVLPLPWRQLKQERIDWAWRQYEKQCARLEWLEDDALPFCMYAPEQKSSLKPLAALSITPMIICLLHCL